MKHIKPLNENWDDDDPDYDIPDDDEPTEPFKRRLDLPKWEKLFHVLYIGDHYALVYMGTDQKDLWIVDLGWGEIREDMENLGFWLVFDADPTTWEENQGGLEDFLTLAWQGKLEIKKEDLFEAGDDPELSAERFIDNQAFSKKAEVCRISTPEFAEVVIKELLRAHGRAHERHIVSAKRYRNILPADFKGVGNKRMASYIAAVWPSAT
jgi:hypothetical protein